MELHELHVHEAAPGLERQGQPIAVVLVAPGGAAPPDARVTAGGEDHRIGQEHRSLAGLQVEGKRAEAGPIGHQEPGDVVPVVNQDPELRALGDQCAGWRAQ